MRLSKKGQSLIDAAVILALVLAGVLIMRPYVTRSLNALFKGYEEDIQQADREKFKIAPPNKAKVGPCRCGPWTPPHLAPCGNGTSCPIGTREFNRSCVSCPPSMPRKQCRPDKTCCTNWTLFCKNGNYDCCGANVSGFQPYGNWPGPGGPNDSCADGYGKAWKRCGGKTSFRCEPSPYCVFDCTGSRDPNSSACPRDKERLTRKSVPWVLVDKCSPPPLPSPPKCERTCNQPDWVRRGTFCEPCPKKIGLTNIFFEIDNGGHKYKWTEGTIPVNLFDFSKISQSIATKKSNIDRITIDVLKIHNSGRWGYEIYNLFEVPAVFDGVRSSYWDAQLSPRFNPRGFKFEIKDDPNTTGINEGDIANYILMKKPPKNCNPGYIMSQFPRYSIPNDNHSENFAAHAFFDTSDRFTELRIYSCSADTDLNEGFYKALFKAHIHLKGCQ